MNEEEYLQNLKKISLFAKEDVLHQDKSESVEYIYSKLKIQETKRSQIVDCSELVSILNIDIFFLYRLFQKSAGGRIILKKKKIHFSGEKLFKNFKEYLLEFIEKYLICKQCNKKDIYYSIMIQNLISKCSACGNQQSYGTAD